MSGVNADESNLLAAVGFIISNEVQLKGNENTILEKGRCQREFLITCCLFSPADESGVAAVSSHYSPLPSAAEEAGLRLPGQIRRGAAGPGPAVHQHLPARPKGQLPHPSYSHNALPLKPLVSYQTYFQQDFELLSFFCLYEQFS